MNVFDRSNLTPEQLEELERCWGPKVQTVELKITLNFNNFGWMDAAELTPERVVEGVRDILGRVWHVNATGSTELKLGAEHHKPECITLNDPMGAFKVCNCGAYGEVGPPDNYWCMLSKLTKVEAVGTKVELLKEVE